MVKLEGRWWLHANTALYFQEFHRCRISISWCFWSIRATWWIMIIFIRIPLFNLRPLLNDVPTNMRMILYGTYHYNDFIPLINILSIKSSLAHLNAFVLTSVCEIQNSDLCKRTTVNVLSEHQWCILSNVLRRYRFYKADTIRTVCALIRGYEWQTISFVDTEALWKRFHKCQFFNIFRPY